MNPWKMVLGMFIHVVAVGVLVAYSDTTNHSPVTFLATWMSFMGGIIWAWGSHGKNN